VCKRGNQPVEFIDALRDALEINFALALRIVDAIPHQEPRLSADGIGRNEAQCGGTVCSRNNSRRPGKIFPSLVVCLHLSASCGSTHESPS
jgi:hypothetical protein